jgi:hypothetical protein
VLFLRYKKLKANSTGFSKDWKICGFVTFISNPLLQQKIMKKEKHLYMKRLHISTKEIHVGLHKIIKGTF